jgi:uncharacterized protein (TIGR02147 family)
MTHAQEILRQEFKKRKDRNPHFSLRAFAKWLGTSPAQLSQMMAGKRPITLKSMNKFSERLGFSPLEKKKIFNSLLQQHDFIETTAQKKNLHLQEDQFRLISDWFHFAILSLTRVKGAHSDPRWIARRLGIPVEQAHEALLRLQRLGLLELKPFFRQLGDPIEMTSSISSEAIRKYHKQNLNLAAEKIETVPVEMREFQSMTLTLNPQKISAFKNQMDEFLQQAVELSESEIGTEVYQLNVQLFPITQSSTTSEGL